jgi:iron complex transport system permease protein
MRKPSGSVTFVILALVLCGAAALSSTTGKVTAASDELASTFLQLRVSRTLVAMLVGAALAVGGVVVQGLFRNPLASPSILGTSAAGSVGGQAALLGYAWVLSDRAPSWLSADVFLPLGCLAGALLGLGILLAVTRLSNDLLVLLLTGFLLSSLFLSIGSFLTTLAQDNWELGRAVIAFTLGDLGGSGPRHVLLVAPMVLIGIGYTWFWGDSLDMMLSGEDEAKSLGVDVVRVRLWAIVWTAVLTAAVVSVAGNVGFVGLVVPHALRQFVGVRHRVLIPAAALGGAAFVVLSDVVCRVMPGQADLPLGVVTGFIGAPVFLLLLVRHQRGGSHV